jgi:predicted nucleotidyltransferase
VKPSIALREHRDEVREVLDRFRMSNPRIFGSASRNEDTEDSDLDILIEAPSETSLYDLAQAELELEAILGCKVDLLTRGFLAPDVIDRVEGDLRPIP